MTSPEARSPSGDEAPTAVGMLGDQPVESRSPQAMFTALALSGLVLAGGTGYGLSLHYAPTPDAAYDSVQALQTELRFGALLRSVHIAASQATILFALCTVVATLLRGAYRGVGRTNWWSELSLFFVVIAIGLTGELLPWTRQAVTATQVRTGLAESSPVVGPLVHDVALGGPQIGAETLLRFHSLHTQVLPLLLFVVVVWRLRALRRLEPGRPRPTILEALTFALGVAGIVYWASLGEPALGFEFVDGEKAFEARPEWHFLWLNGLIERSPAGLVTFAGVAVPGLLTLALFAVPLIDRARDRRFAHPVVLAVAGVLAVGITGLSVAQFIALEAPEPTLRSSLDWDRQVRDGYRLVRREGCVECHVHDQDGITLGAPDDDSWPRLNELADAGEDGIRETLILPPEDMPSYDHLSSEEQTQIVRYLEELEREAR